MPRQHQLCFAAPRWRLELERMLPQELGRPRNHLAHQWGHPQARHLCPQAQEWSMVLPAHQQLCRHSRGRRRQQVAERSMARLWRSLPQAHPCLARATPLVQHRMAAAAVPWLLCHRAAPPLCQLCPQPSRCGTGSPATTRPAAGAWHLQHTQRMPAFVTGGMTGPLTQMPAHAAKVHKQQAAREPARLRQQPALLLRLPRAWEAPLPACKALASLARVMAQHGPQFLPKQPTPSSPLQQQARGRLWTKVGRRRARCWQQKQCWHRRTCTPGPLLLPPQAPMAPLARHGP